MASCLDRTAAPIHRRFNVFALPTGPGARHRIGVAPPSRSSCTPPIGTTITARAARASTPPGVRDRAAGIATNGRVVDWGIVVRNIGADEARDVRLEAILPDGSLVRAEEVYDIHPDPLKPLPYTLTFSADLADNLGGATEIQRRVRLRVFDRDGNEHVREP
jgi:hypothetical protein